MGDVVEIAAGPGIEKGFEAEAGEFLVGEARGFVFRSDVIAVAGAGDEQGADGGFNGTDAGFYAAGGGPGDVLMAAEEDGGPAVFVHDSGKAGLLFVEFVAGGFGERSGVCLGHWDFLSFLSESV